MLGVLRASCGRVALRCQAQHSLHAVRGWSLDARASSRAWLKPYILLQGLGELYEEEYVKATRAQDVVEERDAATVAQARTLLKVRLRV